MHTWTLISKSRSFTMLTTFNEFLVVVPMDDFILKMNFFDKVRTIYFFITFINTMHYIRIWIWISSIHHDYGIRLSMVNLIRCRPYYNSSYHFSLCCVVVLLSKSHYFFVPLIGNCIQPVSWKALVKNVSEFWYVDEIIGNRWLEYVWWFMNIGRFVSPWK